MDWIQARISYLKMRNIPQIDSKNQLNPLVYPLETELTKLARINSTLIPYDKVGSCNFGVYDGMIGDLMNNLSDFSIKLQSYESITDSNCETPANFDSLYREEESYIMSMTDSNITELFKEIHEAMVVFDVTTFIFVLNSFILFSLFLILSKKINKSKRLGTWSLIKIFLKQDIDGSDNKINVQSKKVIFNSTKLYVSQLILLLCALINTDLVSYTKPNQIDSVSDAIESKIEILIPQSLTLYSTLHAAHNGTASKRLINYVMNQPKIKYKSGSEFWKRMKERSLIAIFPTGVFEYSHLVECSYQKTNNFFHKSKDKIFVEHETIVYSRACPNEVRKRVKNVYSKAIEHGLTIKNENDIHKRNFDFKYGKHVNISCIYRDMHENTMSNEQKITFDDVDNLFLLLLECNALYFIILILEICYKRCVNN